jgi:hypothetical protein
LISSLERKERAGIEELSNYLISGFNQVSHLSEVERLNYYLISSLFRESITKKMAKVYNRGKT